MAVPSVECFCIRLKTGVRVGREEREQRSDEVVIKPGWPPIGMPRLGNVGVARTMRTHLLEYLFLIRDFRYQLSSRFEQTSEDRIL